MQRPPIDEVVISFHFAPRAIDGVLVGQYLATRADSFLKHQTKEPFFDEEIEIPVDVEPRRYWLVSADEIWVLQLQFDRLTVNWRKRKGHAYPGFDGPQGVATRAVEELSAFTIFLQQREVDVEVRKVVVAKLNIVWLGSESPRMELAQCIPAVAEIAQSAKNGAPNLHAQWELPTSLGTQVISVSSVKHVSSERAGARVEFRITSDLGQDRHKRLTELGAALTETFERTVRMQEGADSNEQ